MELLIYLIIAIVSFIGVVFAIIMCTKNNYILEYNSNKRKIKFYPAKDRTYHHKKDA